MQTAELKKLIPPGKTIQTNLGYQAHFAGRNPLESFSGCTVSETAEYLILPFSDFFVSEKDLQQIALELNKSAAWKCLAVDPGPQRGCAGVYQNQTLNFTNQESVSRQTRRTLPPMIF